MIAEFLWAKLLFLPLLPLISHPRRIAAVSLCFLVAAVWLAFRTRHINWPVIVAAISWALFAGWESHCNAMGYNIRVDLFLLSPILLTVTLWGIIEVCVPGATTRPIPSRFNLMSLMIAVTAVALALGLLAWLAS